jgi:hypothetical protein
VATLRRYLAQISVSMRPGSVDLIDTSLRHLAGYLIDHHPSITSVARIGRTHIEGFKTSLTSRTGYRGQPGPAKTTVAMRLGHLRGFFDRIIEWGYQDAPPRNPIFAGDIPIRDRPLPRFLDDPTAAALLTAARKLPDLFDRVAVEVLARTASGKASFSASPGTQSPQSATVAGCAPPSGNSTPTATYPCTPESKNCCSNG